MGEAALTLLYVEDEPITRQAVCDLIRRRFPFLVLHTAANGREGMQLFREVNPSLVITDIKMPQMHGIEMSRQIKSQNPALPIIVTSAHSDMEYLIDAIEIGISRYVMKPIDKDKLFDAIDNCVAGIRLERRVKEQQDFIEKLTRAVEQGPAMVVIFDADGSIEYVNRKFSEVTGYSYEEIVGQTGLFLDPLAEGSMEEPWRSLNEGKPWHGEVLSRKKSGETYWESISISPMRHSEGERPHFVAVKEDISARKKAEQEIELLNGTLAARAQELELANRELESFSYTVSHDLRAPLTNINGYCQVIFELYAEELNPQCLEFVQVIMNETLNMNRLIKTLLDFARVTRKEMKREQVDLSEMARAVATECMMREPERKVNFTLAEGVTAYGDANLLRVVLNNLLLNAFKYTSKKDEALIEFGVQEQEGRRVYLVRDNGAGFDMTHSSKLFTAFQRLHPSSEFKGVGIGLATVQRIIQRHGGRIWAEAVPEQGATFYFVLGDPVPSEIPHPESDPAPAEQGTP